jgi:hypothetical protein
MGLLQNMSYEVEKGTVILSFVSVYHFATALLLKKRKSQQYCWLEGEKNEKIYLNLVN